VGGVDPDKLAALPRLFRTLMQAPLMPLLRGFLPENDAVYLLYEQDEPVRVGSPPHIDESLLRSSVRIQVSLSTGTGTPAPSHDPGRFNRVLHARWIKLDDPMMRLMLEVYASQFLGVAVSNPRLIDTLMSPTASTNYNRQSA